MTATTPTRRRLTPGAATLALAAALLAIAGPTIADALRLDPTTSVAGPFTHDATLLGTDVLGRDVAARLLHGGRDLVLTALAAVTATEALAIGLAGVMAFHPRALPAVRFAGTLLLAAPPIVLVLAATTAAGAGPAVVITLLALLSAPAGARYLHAAMAPLTRTGFVENARVAGDPEPLILLRDMLPCIARHIGADAGLRYIAAIYLVATAAFLGADPDSTSWAADLQRSLPGLGHNPAAALTPMAAIVALTVPAGLATHGRAPRRRPPRPAATPAAAPPDTPPEAPPVDGVHVTGWTVTDDTGRTVLGPLHLHLAPGESLAVLGASGAGKSTLARGLLGHLRPGLHRTAGTIHVDGTDVVTATPAALARLRRTALAYLDQDPAVTLTPTLRVRHQLTELAADGATTLPDLLTALDLPTDTGFASRLPRHCSGGQQRRIALGRAVSGGAHWLILDEPTAGLDPATRDTVVAELRRVRDRLGVALIVLTHDDDVADALADRRLVLGEEPAVTAEPAATAPAPPMPAAGARGEAVVDVHALTLSHRGHPPLLRNLDLHVHAGEIVAVTGRSGAGKTTLLRALAGLHRPDTGRVRTRRVSLVGQDPAGALNPTVSIDRSWRRAAARGHGRGDDPGERLAAVGELVGLAPDRVAARPGQLSGGQRQRAALAVALLQNPDVLLLDEVTANVDTASRSRILSALRAIAADGTAIALISHDAAVTALADRQVAVGAPTGRL